MELRGKSAQIELNNDKNVEDALNKEIQELKRNREIDGSKIINLKNENWSYQAQIREQK